VKILTALFAKILIWGAFGTKNANASAVLPDLADVALDEEAGNFIGEIDSCKDLGVWAVHGRRARVIL
jgi:hypothetical protein